MMSPLLKEHVEKLNDLLRQELGHPPYAWKWSEDMTHWMRAIHDDGTPKFDYKADRNTGLILAQPVYEPRNLCLNLENQWVLCRWMPPDLNEHQWSMVFGTSMQYPRNGRWIPCDPIHLDKGVNPTKSITWEVIYCFRRQREKTQADVINEAQEAIEKRDRNRYNHILDQIKDAAPAMAGVPGKKGHYSFGGIAEESQGA